MSLFTIVPIKTSHFVFIFAEEAPLEKLPHLEAETTDVKDPCMVPVQEPYLKGKGLASKHFQTSLSLELDQSKERILTANQRAFQYLSAPIKGNRDSSVKNVPGGSVNDVEPIKIHSSFVPVVIKQEATDDEDDLHSVVLERNGWESHSTAEILRECEPVRHQSNTERSVTKRVSNPALYFEEKGKGKFELSALLQASDLGRFVKQEKSAAAFPGYSTSSPSNPEEDLKRFSQHGETANKGEVATSQQKTTKTSSSSGKKYRYTCDVCDKSFSRSNTLTTHKRIHTGDKPFICEQCGRAFRQPGNLTRHRLTHTTVKPYVCLQCNKAFNRASNLHTHMRTHTNYKPFVCDFCGKGFHQKIDMKIHRYTHTGEKPHKCDKCGRGFKQLTHLTYHLRTHSEMRMYQCEYCGKGFNQKGNLQAHIYGHTGERPFKCQICGKGFTLASTLNTHKRTHAPKKPFQCQFCSKAFYQKNALKTHYIASHPYANGVSLL